MKTMFLLFVFTLSTAAQCDLSVKDSPMLYGVKLGQSGKGLAVAYFQISDQFATTPGFEDVQNIWLDIHKSQITKIDVNYRTPSKWPDTRTFAEYVSAKYKMPEAWSYDDATRATMRCRDFSIAIDSFLNSLVFTVTPDRPAARPTLR